MTQGRRDIYIDRGDIGLPAARRDCGGWVSRAIVVVAHIAFVVVLMAARGGRYSESDPDQIVEIAFFPLPITVEEERPLEENAFRTGAVMLSRVRFRRVPCASASCCCERAFGATALAGRLFSDGSSADLAA